MKWFVWRLGRLAWSPRKGPTCEEITDRRGRWRRVGSNFFLLVERRSAILHKSKR